MGQAMVICTLVLQSHCYMVRYVDGSGYGHLHSCTAVTLLHGEVCGWVRLWSSALLYLQAVRWGFTSSVWRIW